MKLLRIEEKAVRRKTRVNKGVQVLHPAAFGYFEQGDFAKARSHKYIKREPYTTASGKKKYRYWYKLPNGQIVTGGKAKVGASFSSQGEKEGDVHHYIVDSVTDDAIDVRNSKTGERLSISPAALRSVIEHRLEEERGKAREAEAQEREDIYEDRTQAAAKKPLPPPPPPLFKNPKPSPLSEEDEEDDYEEEDEEDDYEEEDEEDEDEIFDEYSRLEKKAFSAKKPEERSQAFAALKKFERANGKTLSLSKEEMEAEYIFAGMDAKKEREEKERRAKSSDGWRSYYRDKRIEINASVNTAKIQEVWDRYGLVLFESELSAQEESQLEDTFQKEMNSFLALFSPETKIGDLLRKTGISFSFERSAEADDDEEGEEKGGKTLCGQFSTSKNHISLFMESLKVSNSTFRHELFHALDYHATKKEGRSGLLSNEKSLVSFDAQSYARDYKAPESYLAYLNSPPEVASRSFEVVTLLGQRIAEIPNFESLALFDRSEDASFVPMGFLALSPQQKTEALASIDAKIASFGQGGSVDLSKLERPAYSMLSLWRDFAGTQQLLGKVGLRLPEESVSKIKTVIERVSFLKKRRGIMQSLLAAT